MKVGHLKKISRMLIKQGIEEIMKITLYIFQTLCPIWKKSEGYSKLQDSGTNRNI